MAATVNISVDQGATFVVGFAVKDDVGAVYDLAGHTAALQVKKAIADTSPLIDATTANTKLVFTAPATGQLEWRIAPADTSSVLFSAREDESAEYVYELKITKTATSAVYKVARGTLTIVRAIV